VVDVTVVGSVGRRKILTRSGGKPGDALYVTGAVGAGAAGLGWLRSVTASGDTSREAGLEPCISRYRRPEPRARAGAVFGRTRTASACMDLSDGLADAVQQMAAASGTGAVIEADLLPIPECARRWFDSRAMDPVVAAVTGGDDYELLFAVPERRRGRLRNAVRELRGLPFTRIGELTASPDIVLERDGETVALPRGYTHF
jgi:thiamine-monophosphate kinase